MDTVGLSISTIYNSALSLSSKTSGATRARGARVSPSLRACSGPEDSCGLRAHAPSILMRIDLFSLCGTRERSACRERVSKCARSSCRRAGRESLSNGEGGGSRLRATTAGRRARSSNSSSFYQQAKLVARTHKNTITGLQ